MPTLAVPANPAVFLGKAATQSTVPPKAGAGLAIDGKKGTATFTLSQVGSSQAWLSCVGHSPVLAWFVCGWRW